MVNEDAILRGLTAISRDGLDGEISPHALHNMISRGHIRIPKVAGRYQSTRRRIRELFEALMDGDNQNGRRPRNARGGLLK
jgi:hypothetical protein